MSYNFSYYEYVRSWPELIEAMNQLETRLRASGHPLAANRLVRAVAILTSDLEALAQRAAIKATELLKESERKTRVRPDTGGGGDKRLGDFLVAEPVGQGLLPGSIGVNDETLLDKEVEWWITNEEGSRTQVDKGRVLYGVFNPGSVAPNPVDGSGKVHPLFQPGIGPGTGSGLVKNPIPAREFVLKAIPEISAMWQAEFHAIKSRFDIELEAAIVMGRV